MLHSPTDDLVGIENASAIFTAAKHPKSFVSLAGADHLLSKRQRRRLCRRGDRRLVGALSRHGAASRTRCRSRACWSRETRNGKFEQSIIAGKHRYLADEPVSAGGNGSGPSPYEYLLAGLGACTSMTIRLYADLKKIPLERVSVALRHDKIHAADCEECETKEGKIDRIDREITLDGELVRRAARKLMEIADKCPVHRTLTSEISIRTREQAAA